jgi:hypothetical protein
MESGTVISWLVKLKLITIQEMFIMETLKITKNMEKDIYFSSPETDTVAISKTEKSPEKAFI